MGATITGAGSVSIGSIIGSGTEGSILFLGPSGALAQDNTNLFWNNTSKLLSVYEILGANKISVGSQDTMIVSGGAIVSQFAAHSDTVAIFEAHTHGVAGAASSFYGAKSRGTEGAETAVVNGDYIAGFSAVGHDGTDYEPVGAAYFVVDGTVSNNIVPGAFKVYTTDTSGGFNLGLTVDSAKYTSVDRLKILNTSSYSIEAPNGGMFFKSNATLGNKNFSFEVNDGNSTNAKVFEVIDVSAGDKVFFDITTDLTYGTLHSFKNGSPAQLVTAKIETTATAVTQLLFRCNATNENTLFTHSPSSDFVIKSDLDFITLTVNGATTPRSVTLFDFGGTLGLLPNDDNLFNLGIETARWSNIWGVNLFADGGVVAGGNDSGDDLTIVSTTDATKGNIFFGAGGVDTFDDVNDRWGLGIAAPAVKLHVESTAVGTYTDILGLTRESIMRVYRTSTAASLGAFTSTASFEFELNNSALVSPLGANAFVAYCTTKTGMSFNVSGTMRALNPVSRHYGTGTVTTLYSIGGEAGNMTTGTITTMSAMNFLIRNDGGGTVTTANLIRLDRPTGRTSGSPNSTWTTIIGIQLPDMTPSGASNTVTNATEVINITAQTGTGAMTIRSPGTGGHMRHAGDVMIGSDATPNANLEIRPAAGTGTLNPEFLVTAGTHTALTASTEHHDVHINTTRTVQWSTGGLTLQRFVRFGQPTIGFVGASTATVAASVYIDGAPIKGTNASVTNTIALYVDGLASVSTATNAYGLFVTAPTGATNNTAGYFGGRVGINVLTPSVDLHVGGGFATTRTTVSLTADNQVVTTSNASYIALSSNNATATNRTFVLSQGSVAGHRLTLEWVGTNAGELVDDSAVSGGGNHRLSATWTPTQYDIIELIWNGTDWLELNRSTN